MCDHYVCMPIKRGRGRSNISKKGGGDTRQKGVHIDQKEGTHSKTYDLMYVHGDIKTGHIPPFASSLPPPPDPPMNRTVTEIITRDSCARDIVHVMYHCRKTSIISRPH